MARVPGLKRTNRLRRDRVVGSTVVYPRTPTTLRGRNVLRRRHAAALVEPYLRNPTRGPSRVASARMGLRGPLRRCARAWSARGRFTGRSEGSSLLWAQGAPNIYSSPPSHLLLPYRLRFWPSSGLWYLGSGVPVGALPNSPSWTLIPLHLRLSPPPSCVAAAFLLRSIFSFSFTT